MNNLAIIPARGGSKRIPRKNIKEFLGKPIIAYSIQAAKDSGLFDRIIVSTEDSEIASIAIHYGAEVPFLRSKINSSDYATTNDVLLEVIENVSKELIDIENICCIYPAAPLISTNALIEGLNLLNTSDFDAVFPAFNVSKLVYRSFQMDNSNSINLIFDDFKRKRSQDLDNAFIDAGQWYWIKRDRLTSLDFGKNQGVIIVDEMNVQDIDTPNDWTLAEFKYRNLYEANN